MKKTITLLLPLLLLLSACGKKGDPKDYVFPQAPYAGEAVRYTNTNLDGVIRSVSFTEGGSYLLTLRPDPKKPADYLAGTYSVDADKTYRLQGYGTVKAGTTKAAADEILQMTFTPDEGQSVTIPCTVTPAAGEDQLYRQWRTAVTRIRIEGETPVAADFAGCDVNEICAFLRENGMYDGEDFPAGQKVSLVDISGLDEITILYENGNVDHAQITSHRLSVIGYRWTSTDMGFGFENGEATVAYDGDTCIFTIMGNITRNGKATKVSLTWALKEKKI